MSRSKRSERRGTSRDDVAAAPADPAWPTGSPSSWIATLGLAVYAAGFFATRLPSLPQRADGETWQRVDFFEWLLIPDELVGIWFDNASAGALVERVGLALVAIALLAVAGVVGAGLLRLVGAEDTLALVERYVFSLAVGLSVVSLYTLCVGLAGLLQYRCRVHRCRADRDLRWCDALVLGRRRHRLKHLPLSTTRKIHDARPWYAWPWLVCPLVIVLMLGGMMPPRRV